MSKELSFIAEGDTKIKREIYADIFNEKESFLFGMEVHIGEFANKMRDQIEKATADYFNLVKELLAPKAD